MIYKFESKLLFIHNNKTWRLTTIKANLSL